MHEVAPILVCNFFFAFWQAIAPTPDPSLEIGVRGIRAAQLTLGMPVGTSDARRQVVRPGHGRQSHFHWKKIYSHFSEDLVSCFVRVYLPTVHHKCHVLLRI